ncbi:putative transposase [Staphylococcus schweitzeri]|nr:putative transposase [Staphylococcus schweitzeri]
MALNIRKIAAQRAVHYKMHIKKADFYQIINRNQLFYIAYELYVSDCLIIVDFKIFT